ncbi:polyprenol phosphomannose-dependent alpha 1,6 mannosyltransferase MptB [Micromonospora sp. NPDC049900]|uniref:polyprenol phosphomannose-dependent alpha 1,6 mannosyltransferase MptB n=1 Tax=Micromonospora sp. NPDC049900 TaxID=3364275 RepID=UPI0037AAFC41
MSDVPHHLVRWTGLAGSIMLAVAAFLGGALPDGDLRPTPLRIWQGPYGPLIIALWLFGTAAMAFAWWTLRDRVPSARWALVTAGLWLVPFLFTPPLGSRDAYAYACQGASFANGISPYEYGVSTLPCPWLDTMSFIWRDTPAPYGPLFVVLSGAIVAATGSLIASIALFRVLAVAGVLLTAVSLPVLARHSGVPVGRALWLALAGPLVGVHLISGVHNDALMVGFMVAGLAIVVSRPARPWPLLAGGVVLGLAAGIKVTALVVVPFAALLAIGGGFSLRGLLRHGTPVVGGAVATLIAVTLGAGLNLGWITGLSHGNEVIAWTSPATAVGQTVGYVLLPFGLHVDALPVTRGIGMAVLAALLVWLWFRARHREPLWHAALALTATVALAPLFHPWYWFWPLALLAATAHRTWWFSAVTVFAAFQVLADGTGLPRYTKTVGAPLMTLFVIWVAVRLVRSARAARRPVPVD